MQWKKNCEINGQADFYEEMMKERRRIRQVRLLQAKAKAERRAL